MKKQNVVRLVSFLGAIIIAISGFYIKMWKNNQALKLQLENNYSRSLNDFSASLNNISLILKKAQYVTSPNQLTKYAAELLSEAEMSKTALAQLPSSAHLDKLNRFLSQAGNYAFAVSSKLYKGEKLPQDFANNVITLSKTAEKVSQIVNTVQISFDNPEYWVKEIEQKIDIGIDDNITTSLQEIEGEFEDYPTLVYDGPYSDHLLTKEPAMLSNVNNVTRLEAQNAACDFFDLEQSQLQFVAEEKGKIEAYRFSYKNTNISISKAGGYAVYMRKNRDIEQHILSYNQALEKAKRFMAKNSLINFIETYYFIDEGVCVINFAYLDGETICYTDLIKVGIAMDSGEVMFYESSGYLSNHKKRAFQTATFTPYEAKEKVSKELKINKTSVALIPTQNGTEERCYEFACIDGDTEVLVYINVLNLNEEEILILLKSDGGTLAK